MPYKYPSLRTTLPVAGYYARLDAGAAATDQFTADGSQNGTLTNGATRSGSPLAYSLDGVDDYIAMSSMTISGNRLSVACWANLTSTAGVQMLVSQYGSAGANRGWYLANIGGALRFLVSSDGTTTPFGQGGTVSTGWHHYAGVLTGTAFQLYIDGIAVTTTLTGTYPSTIFNSTEILEVGARYGSDSPMVGLIDDVVIYHATLAATEIGYLASQLGAIYAQVGGSGLVNGQSLVRPAGDYRPQSLVVM